MGVCAFVACGLNFDVDEYLLDHPFEVLCVFHKGEIPPADNQEKLPRQDSGFVAVVSHDDFPHLLDQIAEALDFLETNEDEFERLRGLGADSMLLDFRVPQEIPPQHTHYLPTELIQVMSRLQMGVLFSVVEIIGN
jgi:hypothetical protein